MASVALNQDPLKTLGDGASARAGGRTWPIPLLSTSVSVDVLGGLGVVRVERSFRNAEATPIEATLTFPVPGDAILTGLRATIDGRELVAAAQPSKRARATYENALDRGKAAVLHEEKLRGVHMLSLGNLAPGKEARVVVSYVAPLSFVGPSPSLRVPTTVGEVYGRSPLLPSDALVTSGDVAFEADVRVTSDSGVPQVLGLGAASGKVALDRAIEVVVPGWAPAPVVGRSADGRPVTLRVEPLGAGELPLDMTVLFDRSGSTNEGIDGDRAGRKVWDAMRDGVRTALDERMRPDDRVAVTEFDDSYREIGEATGREGVLALVERIRPRGGGTEIGIPLIATAKARKGRDVLLVTDGRSTALDVQAISALGARVCVVLVGTGALDAAVGHVAALTGGQSFVAVGADVAGAVRAAIGALRIPAGAAEARGEATGLPAEAAALRGGARIHASWGGPEDGKAADDLGRFAAGLVLPTLSEAAATDLAVSHGLCTHLTSLVVVDEAGESVEGIPATRKVPLMASASASLQALGGSGMTRSAFRSASPKGLAGASASLRAARGGGLGMFSAGPMSTTDDLMETSAWLSDEQERSGGPFRGSLGGIGDDVRRRGGPRRPTTFPGLPELDPPAAPAPAAPPPAIGMPELARLLDLRATALRVDWDDVAPRVAREGVSAFPNEVRLVLLKVAALPEVAALAKALGKTAEQVAVSLLALAAGEGVRAAGRVSRQGLREAPVDAYRSAVASVGL